MEWFVAVDALAVLCPHYFRNVPNDWVAYSPCEATMKIVDSASAHFGRDLKFDASAGTLTGLGFFCWFK